MPGSKANTCPLRGEGAGRQGRVRRTAPGKTSLLCPTGELSEGLGYVGREGEGGCGCFPPTAWEPRDLGWVWRSPGIAGSGLPSEILFSSPGHASLLSAALRWIQPFPSCSHGLGTHPARAEGLCGPPIAVAGGCPRRHHAGGVHLSPFLLGHVPCPLPHPFTPRGPEEGTG